MNRKIIFLSLLFVFVTSKTFSQAPVGPPKSIINTSASLGKYYDIKELQGLQKGQLLTLYIERIKVLVSTLPYIALTTKPGITLADVGIPSTPDNIKSLDTEIQNTATFINGTVDFQKRVTPYADKGTLITAILFYETILKDLHTLGE